MQELRDRVVNAINTLEIMIDEAGRERTDPHRHTHLKGKHQGLKVALSYIDEEIREETKWKKQNGAE